MEEEGVRKESQDLERFLAVTDMQLVNFTGFSVRIE